MEPSGLPANLHGDLDWVVMKTLEKERDRRYESIRELSNDLDRYLQEQPVAARPPSIAYRTSKYVRRNRVLIGTASLLIGIMAVATAVSVSARRTAIRERNTANDEREIADQERHRASQNLKLAQQSEAQALVAERTTAQALEKSKRFQYAAEMVQASYALAEGDISRMHELLERQPHELREFEHDYLRHAGRKRDEVVCNTEDKILNLLPSSVNDQILVTYNQGLAIYTSDWEIVKKYESDYVKTAYDGERLAYTKSLTELAFAVAGQPPQEKTWSCQHRIACLDFSPTSSELAILAEDGLRVLNPDTMDEKRITSDVQPVWVNDRSIAFSPNGKWLAASDGRGTVRVWDTETYELQHEFSGGLSLPRSWNFGALQFSNDSMLLAVAFAERILVFNFNTSKERELGLPAYINDITAISLSHNNGNMIAVCNADGTITVIDSRTGAVLDRLIGHEQRVRAVQFRENGALLSAGVDRTIRKWQDVGDIAKDVYTTTVDFKFLQELGFLPHGGITFLRKSTQDEHYPWRSTVAIRHPDGTVTATPIHSWRHWFAVSGTGLLAVLVERQFQVWNLKERPPRLVDRMKLANAFEMTDDGTSGRLEISRNAEVVAFIASGAIQLWHRKQSNHAEVFLQLKSSGDVSGMLALSPDGSLIAASQAGLISLGDTSKPDWIAGQEWEPWDAGEKTSDLCFSPDGRFMAAQRIRKGRSMDSIGPHRRTKSLGGCVGAR